MLMFECFKKHKTLIALVITILFAVVQIPLLLNHEPWMDEGISWELSKDINLTNIYEVNAAEPHPILWQLILAPFSQNNFPVITLSFISLALVSLAVFLLVRFAPFNYFIKIIFILSSGFFYFNPIISRDYSLIPLAICLVCLAYKNRHQKPLLYGLSLAFLTQTHFLMYGLAGVLTIGFIVEEFVAKNKTISKKLRANLIFLIPILLSILSVIPLILGSMQNQAILNGYIRERRILVAPSGSLFEHTLGTYLGFYVNALEPVIYILLTVIIINALAENLKLGFYLLGSLAFWIFCLLFIYDGYAVFFQKVSILTLIFIATTWLLKNEGKNEKPNFVSRLLNFSEIVKFFRVYAVAPTGIALTFLVACTVPQTFSIAKSDFESDFSGSKATADFVNHEIEVNSLIIEANGHVASNTFNAAVLAQIKNRITFYNVPLRTYDDRYIKLRYASADHEALKKNEFNEEELINFLKAASEKYDHIYYVDSIPGCKNAKPYNDEALNKYEVVKILGTKKYLTPAEYPTKVYKVK